MVCSDSRAKARVNVNDDGRVQVQAADGAALEAALARVDDLTGIPRLGERREGTVVSVQHFGSFVRIFEGIDGLLRDEQLEVNQRLAVRVASVDSRGKLVLERV